MPDRCPPGWWAGRTIRAALVLGLVLALCACGSTAAHHPARSRAAEPAHDPTPQPRPAGRSVPVGSAPQGIAIDAAGIVAVGIRTPPSVALLDAGTERVIGRVALDAGPRHIQLGTPNGPFLIGEEPANLLLELSEPSGHQQRFRTGDFPHEAAEADGYVYVANERAASLTVIAPDGHERLIGGFTQPSGGVGIGHQLAIVDVGAFTLSLLDARSGRLLGRLPAGRGPTHDEAAQNRVWVLDTRGNQVITYSVHPFRQLGVTPVPASPYGVALDRRRRRLWVTETGANALAELSLAGALPRIARTYPTGVQPDTVAVDSRTGRVAVANQVSGTVEFIDPSR